MKIRKTLGLLFILGLVFSCRLDPKYQKPQTPIPLEKSSKEKAEISQIPWQKFFKSPDLQRVINLALDNNKNLKEANFNIESAQATYGIARSKLLPNISAVASQTHQGVPSAFSSFTPKRLYRANLSLSSYEIDFFGRLRSLKDVALEDFLATQEARNVTRITLIAETANAYAQLLLDRKIVEISNNNLSAQQQKTDLIKLRYESGIDSKADLLSALSTLESARMTRDSYQEIVKQDENALMLLTGVFDEKSLPKISSIDEIEIDESLLEFLPSETLLARPDIKQAEHELKSANFDIGAARAAFFPSITLTGNYGYYSRGSSSLFSSKSWAYMPQINLPIFSGGANIAALKSAKAEKKIEVVQYEKAIQNAFAEVKNEIATRESMVLQLKSVEEILKAKTASFEIVKHKHVKGINSAIDVADSQISLLSAKQDRFSTKKEYLTNLIELYKVMGGGGNIDVTANEEMKDKK